MDILSAAKKIWDYHHLNNIMEKTDCIIVLGSHDTRVAERGAELFLEGYAPIIVFSGYLGSQTLGNWNRPEAEIFAEIAINMGVPEDKIIIEDKATNTGENITFSKKLLFDRGINPKSIIAVQKPYMERRTYATVKKLWPEIKVLVTSPQFTFENYPTNEITLEKVINIMIGDFQRILLYPDRGFLIPQEVPAEVLEAYNFLVEAGYTAHLIQQT